MGASIGDGRQAQRLRRGGPGGAPPAVFLLGPQGSGTELCAEVLALLGGRLCRSDDVEALCDRVLGLFGREGALRHYPLPPAWWADARLDDLGRSASRLFAAEAWSAARFPVLSGPRLARLLPFWLRAAAAASVSPRVVIALRPPAAMPSHALDPAGTEVGALDHLVDALRASGSHPRCSVTYADWFADPAPVIGRLMPLLDPAGVPPVAELVAAVSDTLVRYGIHPADRDGPPARQPLVRHVFGVALDSPDPDRLAARLGTVIAQVVAFRQLLTPLERSHVATLDRLAASEAAAREGDRIRVALEQAQVAMSRVERARDLSDRARAALETALGKSKAAQNTAEMRVARLESSLAEHATALSDALERLRGQDGPATETAHGRTAPETARPVHPTVAGWRRVLRLG